MGTRWLPLGGSMMRCGVRTTLAAALIAVSGLIPAPPVIATAEHDTCVRRLLDSPLESSVLPNGWEWLDLSLGEYYWPGLPSQTALVGQLKWVASDTGEGEVWLTLICEPNADLLLERTFEAAVRLGAEESETEPIGGRSVAFVVGEHDYGPIMDHALPGATVVLWRDGDVLGRAVGAGPGALELIARGVSDVLAANGLTGPITNDDACVRRILTAPIETLEGDPRPYAFPTVTPTWVGILPSGEDSLFFLSCQPEAGLVMQRAAEVAAGLLHLGPQDVSRSRKELRIIEKLALRLDELLE